MAAALAHSRVGRVLVAALACALLWTAVLACAVAGPRWQDTRNHSHQTSDSQDPR